MYSENLPIGGTRTHAKPGNLAQAVPHPRIRHLLLDHLEHARGDNVHAEPKRRRMQQKLVHDHVRDHDDGEEHGQDDADEACAIWAGVEGEDAVDDGCGEEVHGELVGWRFVSRIIAH